MFPADVGPNPGSPPATVAVVVAAPEEPEDDPGADRSFTLFLELNMLSICSSIWEGHMDQMWGRWTTFTNMQKY